MNSGSDIRNRDGLPERIWLCGFMGAGKTSAGRELAARLEREFTDLDRVIAGEAGMEIPEIFRREGEKGFRRRERASLDRLAESGSGVIALGGGALQDRRVADRLKRRGLLVFIDTPFSVIFHRIAGDRERPLAAPENAEMGKPADDEDKKEELKALYEERRPRYEQAELTVSPLEGETPAELADRLARKIRTHVSDL